MVSSYSELLEEIAKECDGYSGAALAGVARAAASHALERAVVEFSEYANGSMMDCLVTKEDFKSAVADVLTSTDNSDFSEVSYQEDRSDDEPSLD
jgi:SpoVK/Ycf46/Vps4 family AAA+-type ATPase